MANKRDKIRPLSLLVIATFLVTIVSPAALGFDLKGAYRLSDSELDDIRGKYAGFYFSFDFSGYWDTLGNSNAALTYSGNVGDIVVTGIPPSFPTTSEVTLNGGGRVVRMQAIVGNLNSTSGMIQISQVPGSNNIVTTVMNVQLTVINVMDSSQASRLSALLPTLMGY